MITVLDRHTREVLFFFPENSFTGKDLRHYPLRQADLSGQDLSFCNMEGMNLEEIELSGSTLVETRMSGANLTEAVCGNALMTKVRLKGATVTMASFARADMTEGDLSGIVFEGIVNFTEAIAVRTKFRDIKNLKGAIFWNTNCTDAKFEGSNLTQVNPIDLIGATLKGTLFEYLGKK